MKKLVLSVVAAAMFTASLAGEIQDTETEKLEVFSRVIADGSMRASMASEKCRREWESDFTMQVYCREQQEEGFRDFATLWNDRVVDNDALVPAGARCILEWEDDGLFDFTMIHYCLERQVEAYDSLR